MVRIFTFVFVIFCYLILPQYKSLITAKTELKNENENLAQLKNYFKEIEEVSEKLKSHPEELTKINEALPKGFILSSFLAYLEKSSSENGMIIKEISLIPIKKGKEVKKISETSLNLTVVGDYSSFKNFLNSLEQSSRLIEIENIELKTDPKTLPSYSLLLKIYSY